MNPDLIQMLAEPGQRQLIVAGGAAALGAVKRMWEAYHTVRTNTPLYRIKLYYALDNSTRKDLTETLQKNKWLTRASWGLPAAVGLEEAVRSNSAVADSYVLEGASDIACGLAGYYAGKIGISLTVKGIAAAVSCTYKVFNGKKSNK